MSLLRSCVVVASLVVTVSHALRAQGLDEWQRALGRDMLGVIHYVLDSLYYDSTFGGRDPAELWWGARRAVEQAPSVGHMLYAIAQSLQGLNDSHTWFIPPAQTLEADYGWQWLLVGDSCYVSDVEGDAKSQGVRRGDRVLAIDGIDASPSNLQFYDYAYHELAPRERMRLLVEHPDGTTEEIVFDAKTRRLSPVQDLADVETRRRWQNRAEEAGRIRHTWETFDSVAVWHFSQFGFEDRRLDRHMQRARDYSALILDLRGNPGGAVEGIGRLLGHFTDSAYAGYTQHWRDSTTEHTIEPRGRGGPYGGRVVVLLNRGSASSAEISARILQERYGVTVVGDRAAGAVKGANIVPLYLESGTNRNWIFFGMSVTVFDVVLAGGDRLEGAHVVPDERVAPTGEDIAEDHDPVVQRALELVGVTVSAEEAGRFR